MYNVIRVVHCNCEANLDWDDHCNSKQKSGDSNADALVEFFFEVETLECRRYVVQDPDLSDTYHDVERVRKGIQHKDLLHVVLANHLLQVSCDHQRLVHYCTQVEQGDKDSFALISLLFVHVSVAIMDAENDCY